MGSPRGNPLGRISGFPGMPPDPDAKTLSINQNNLNRRAASSVMARNIAASLKVSKIGLPKITSPPVQGLTRRK